MEEKNKAKAIGIDLGTTYSCVAALQNERVEILVNDQGNRTTPSMVAFTSSETGGERLVGEAAKHQVATNPQNTVFDTKRLIGRRFSDPCVENDMRFWPFSIVSGRNDKPMVQVTFRGEKKLFAAEEISSMVLMKMKVIAEASLMCEVKDAVITVPAYFNGSQRQATKDAGMIAGLNVIRIMNEPTAAAIAYGFHTNICTSTSQEEKTILVFDLGGGTFDVSILTVESGGLKVRAVGGDMHLGGEDFDNRMLNCCVQEFKRKHNKDISGNAKALRRLRAECERAKRSLSCTFETVIDIDSLCDGIDFHTNIRRAKFEELLGDLFEKCMEIVKKCLVEAKMTKTQIDEVVMVGGSSRIPKIQQLLQDFFDGKELCTMLNPDEAVAYGAAVEASSLNGDSPNLVLQEVTPLSLGVETKGGVMSIVVPKHTPIPTHKEEFFTTAYDYQETVAIQIYEGERLLTGDNALLGTFHLNGIPAARCKVPQIKTSFEIDADGILKVSARERSRGVSNDITIRKEDLQISKEEIERMIAEAEKFRKEDEMQKRRYSAKHDLESYVHNMRFRLKKAKKREDLDYDDVQKMETSVKSTLKWIKDNVGAEAEELEVKLLQLQLDCTILEGSI